MNVKQTSVFKNLFNTTLKKIDSKIVVQNKLKLPIIKKEMIFTKLLNTNGYQLSKTNGDYYFDFDDDKIKFKDINIVVYDIDNKQKLTFKIYKIDSIYSYKKQIEETIQLDPDNQHVDLLTTAITCTNISDIEDSWSISSAYYRFLFTNNNKNILYYFNNEYSKFPLIIKQLKEHFGVSSIDFFIDEKNPNRGRSRSPTPINGGGWYKKQMKKYN